MILAIIAVQAASSTGPVATSDQAAPSGQTDQTGTAQPLGTQQAASPSVTTAGPGALTQGSASQGSASQGAASQTDASGGSTGLLLPRGTATDIRPSFTDGTGGVLIGDRRLDTVTLRRRPAYDPVGIRAGSYLIFPEVSSTVGYDSNVYRQRSGASDVFGRVRGAVQVRSDFPRNAVVFDGYVDQRVYGSYSTENALTYDAHLLGRLDFGRNDRITTEVRHTRAVMDRGAASEILNTREPIRYDVTISSIAGRKTFGRLSLGLGGAVSYADYDDAETPAGLPLSQQFRDSTVYQLHGDAGYALAAGPELFVSVTGEARRFRVAAPPITRDANSVEVLGGVRSDITPLLRGQIGIGYIHADFKDPTIRSRGALGINVALDYLVTPLTTLHASARRELRNVASVTAPAALVTEGRVGVDHELLRNLILSGSVGYQHADYLNSDGTVRRYTVDGGARWLLNRRIRVDFDAGYQRRDGSGRANNQEFGETRASVGVAYHL